MTTTHTDIATWHRRLCPVTDQLVISGDLNEDPELAIEQLAQWQDSGITHILDTREEWTDEAFVADHAPDIIYGWFGTNDDGSPQSDKWFDDGVDFATRALQASDAVLLVHCHLGVNRGPSMAHRILLEQGWDPIEAFDAIQAARPIAHIRYATDALRHHDRASDASASGRARTMARLEQRIRASSPWSWNLRRTR